MPHDKIKKIEEITKKVLDKIGIESNIETIEIEEVLTFNIKTPDSALLIGKYGETLDSLEHILKLLSRKQFDIDEKAPKLVFDINNYKKDQSEKLKSIAKYNADKVLSTRRPEVLRPMNSYERRLVHLVLKEYEELMTESTGEEPSRRIIIKIKDR